MTFETAVRDGVCRLARPDTRWLSTGYDGGECRAPAAYNCTVPTGWERTDLDAYIADRLADAGFDARGPVLLTGVDQRHARRARLGSVEAVATAGVTNPARLPVDPDPEQSDGDETVTSVAEADHAGTVNVVVGTTRSLAAGALPTLLTVAAEAKAATLLELVGAPGTTTDAVVAACDSTGDPAQFAGSATPVGAAARACVRDAVAASLRARYPDGEFEAVSGVVTDDRATVTPVASDD